MADRLRTEIPPEIAESFEREANAFACEVLFQLDAFQNEAEQEKISILVPVRLSKRYGSSIYSAVRRYVSKNSRICMVLVLEPPVACNRRGFVAKFRREVISPPFRHSIGPLSWPDEFGPDDSIGALIPFGGNRRMSRPRRLRLKGMDGTLHDCIGRGVHSNAPGIHTGPFVFASRPQCNSFPVAIIARPVSDASEVGRQAVKRGKWHNRDVVSEKTYRIADMSLNC